MIATRHRSVAWTRRKRWAAALAVLLGLLVGGGVAAPAGVAAAAPAQYIVQGTSSAAAAQGVRSVHGKVLGTLPGIHGVVADLTSGEVAAGEHAGLQVSPNLPVKVQGSTLPAGSHPSDAFNAVTGATSMWANGVNGSGVTVAVLDTGIDDLPDFGNRLIDGVNLNNPWNPHGWSNDGYGHGTFVAGLIASDGQSSGGQYTGVAPGADLVSIKVAGSSGMTTESTVIQGVEWAIANEAQDQIRVLNMSLGTEPASPSALDPLDQAVEQAWNAGIVVVTSAGNVGPDNGTITSPGNDPLAITVGALDDGGADNPADFAIPSFSSVGPTLYDGWFKPDIVAPGRSVVSLAAPGSVTWWENPQARIGASNFVGSGTSFSAAIVSGLVALMLQQNPSLTPDQVKAALLMSASPGPVGDPFVDGHGIANVAAASAVAGQVDLDQSAAAAAESSSPPYPVSLAATWAVSTWNPANWSGSAWSASPLSTAAQSSPSPTAVQGTNWNGLAWNGLAWNGLAWNGLAWNGVAWNGLAWNGLAWNGLAWNGLAWNGLAWNGLAWNGDTWG